jgi:hypothetical protein
MVDHLFRKRDNLRTIYAYWQPPNSLQDCGDRQIQTRRSVHGIMHAKNFLLRKPLLSNSSTESFQHTCSVIREEI